MSVQCGYSNPIDFLEYVLRCQNWGDNATGEPSPTALIRKGAVAGSFDSSTLDNVRAINIRYQIDKVDSSNSKDLIDKICKQFSLQQYTDVDGYECVKFLFADTYDNTVDTIIIPDTLDQPIKYTDPDTMKMCVNPVIKYNYDYATQEYKDVLTITNVQTGIYNPAYAYWFQGLDGKNVWNMLRNLIWPLVKRVEKIDQEWSENEFIIDYDGAMFRLINIINIMKSATVSFEVPFEIGYKYNAGDVIKVSFPHLSCLQDYVKTCTIKTISKSKQDNRCSITCFVRDFVIIEQGDSWQDNDDEGEIIQNNDDTGEPIKE